MALDDWVVPIIVKLLSSHQQDIRAQVVLALGTIAGVSAECRDLVLGCGGLTALLAQLNGDIEVSIIRNTTWALCQLFYNQPYLPLEQMKLALPALQILIPSNDETVCSYVCEAISAIAADTTAGIQAVIEADVCSQLVELLQHPSPSAVLAASRTIQNIACGDDVQKQCLIDHQVLPALKSLIHSNGETVCSNACEVISTIANTTAGIQAVIEADVWSRLVELLQHPSPFVVFVAFTTIQNIAHGDEVQIQCLIDHQVFPALKSLIHSNDEIVKAYHLEDKSPPSDTPVAGSPKGLAEELEGGREINLVVTKLKPKLKLHLLALLLLLVSLLVLHHFTEILHWSRNLKE